MKHLTEEELFAYRDGEAKGRESVAAHLQECAECRGELARTEAVFAALDTIPVPDPGEDYGRHVWQQIAPRLPGKSPRWWGSWFSAGQLAVVGAVAILLIAAFFVRKITKSPKQGGAPDFADAGQVRERVLVVAVGEHLGRSEMVLVELANTQPQAGQKVINISTEQKRAEDLVEANRLYRQTALKEGDKAMVSTLDELERVLLEVANSPDGVTPAQFAAIRKRIESQGILFKVRVVRQELDERRGKPYAAPVQNESKPTERNKI